MSSTRLMTDEQPLRLSRQHWSVVAPQLAAGVLLLVAAIVGLALLPASVAGQDVGGVKVVAGALAGVAALTWCLTHYLRWRMRTYLLTDRRIVVEEGVLSRRTESIALDRIQNTVIRRPLGDRMIGAGDIDIESAGRDGAETLHRIPQAQSFYTELLQAVESSRASGVSGPPSPAL